MDQEHVADSLRNMLLHIRRVGIAAYPGDKNQHHLMSLIEIPHPSSEFVQRCEPHELADYYYGQVRNIHEYLVHAEASELRSYVLGIVTKVESWEDRGIISDMIPQTKPQEKLVTEPEMTDGEELRAWRIESFRDLKFSELEAKKLAGAITVDIIVDKRTGESKRYESPLHHSRAKRMLDEGCNHRQVVNLLT